MWKIGGIMTSRAKVILVCLLTLLFSGNVALAKCRASLPREDWSWSRGDEAFICKTKNCGGKGNLLRFSDQKLNFPQKLKGKVQIVPSANLPRHFKGMMREKIEDRHGNIYHIGETYIDAGRLVGLDSEGLSKATVRKNFAVLKKSLKCR